MVLAALGAGGVAWQAGARVGVLERTNRLLLQDTAGNLRLVVRTVQDVEAQESKKRDTGRE